MCKVWHDTYATDLNRAFLPRIATHISGIGLIKYKLRTVPMPLISRIFRNDRKLEACLTSDPAHVTQGAIGGHVGKIQTALMILDGARIDGKETVAELYGPSTAAAVLAYKKKRRIINLTYQTQADNIVGKMTIAALDREMVQFERGLREYNSCSGKRNRYISR